jgi:hypothetical protein
MFLDKRVYQGSSGKVYPNAFTDHISDTTIDKAYRAIFLENEFIRIMILPEIGGRIHIGQDKTNNYDFFYRQNVIKPALVGLLGPWISGGVEFNWPQHHRPSTFMPVNHKIEEHDDGSRTVWLSEHEPMNRMKGMVGITLHPGKSIIEAKAQLYTALHSSKHFCGGLMSPCECTNNIRLFSLQMSPTSGTTRNAPCLPSHWLETFITAWITHQGWT